MHKIIFPPQPPVSCRQKQWSFHSETRMAAALHSASADRRQYPIPAGYDPHNLSSLESPQFLSGHRHTDASAYPAYNARQTRLRMPVQSADAPASKTVPALRSDTLKNLPSIWYAQSYPAAQILIAKPDDRKKYPAPAVQAETPSGPSGCCVQMPDIPPPVPAALNFSHQISNVL